MYSETTDIAKLISDANTIAILQADNPDGDSLGSALALEEILGDQGKHTLLYCGVDVPAHLKYLSGWDRVSNDLPSNFDLSIIVDTSSASLFEQAGKTGVIAHIKNKPVIVLDHHDVESTINFATVICNQPVVSTGELIYELSKQLGWQLNQRALDAIAVSIMSDSLGLTTEATSPRTIHVVAELVEAGVKLANIENLRRALNRKSPSLTHYKGELLQRVTYYDDDRIATVTIPWPEIERYSPEYNPSVLVLDDMRMTINTAVAVAFKVYADGKITAKIRCNYGFPVAGKIAEHFGGGGHVYASGFKVTGTTLEQLRNEFVTKAIEFLNELDINNETI